MLMLFNLSEDLGEENNLAASQLSKVAELRLRMEQAHQDNDMWQQ